MTWLAAASTLILFAYLVYALLRIVRNIWRMPQRVAAYRARSRVAKAHAALRDAIGNLLPRCGLLVNTTSLGMHGQPALAIDIGLLPSHAVVADLVYVPLETPLLAGARARGLKTADGLGMLLHQAVRGFELWFGQRPEVTSELRALVEADLTKV